MKAKEIRELIDFIASTGLEEVNIETEEFKVKVKRSADVTVQAAAAQAPTMMAAPTSLASPAAVQDTPAAEATPNNYLTIKSPMIGTFYTAANPESADFVKVGDGVKTGDTVCIVEAMKLFNEIESEVSGKIVEILVENASPVEFDQPLFLIDPS
jgi:acetyl-CoA carboxylase biotin carboxyl carrier protein